MGVQKKLLRVVVNEKGSLMQVRSAARLLCCRTRDETTLVPRFGRERRPAGRTIGNVR